MTKEEFRAAMIRGQGRCYIALKTEDKEEFRDIVKEESLKVNTCNTQDDGFLDEYYYNLIKCYDYTFDIFSAVIDELSTCGYEESTDRIRHLAKLATRFVKDNAPGSDRAREVFLKRYAALYVKLDDPNRCVDWVVDYDVEVFCSIVSCMLDYDGEQIVGIANDVGRLLTAHLFESVDFDWIWWDLKANHMHLVKKLQNESNIDVNAFLAAFGVFLAWQNKHEKEDLFCQLAEQGLGDLFNRFFPGGLLVDDDEDDDEEVEAAEDEDADDEEAEAPVFVAEKYNLCDLDKAEAETIKYQVECNKIYQRLCELEEKQEYEKIPMRELAVLMKFDDSRIGDKAKAIFSMRRDEEAIEYAKMQIAVASAEYHTVLVLLRNYREEFKDFLLYNLSRMDIYFGQEEEHWHAILASLAYDADEEGWDCPTELYLWGYESSLCRNCRFSMIEELAERDAVPESVQEECWFDANEEIRDLAKEYGFKKLDL